jgi:hypothetical protein
MAILKVNAWQVRIVALSLLVLSIGSGSQFLANALAAGTEIEVQNVQNTMVITTPTINSYPSTIHVHSRRAGVDTFGGYTVTGKR